VFIVIAVIAGWIVGWRLVDQSANTDVEESASPSSSSSPSAGTTVSIGDAGEVHVVTNLAFEVPRREVTLLVSRGGGAGVVFDPSVEVLSLDAAGRSVVLEKTLGVGDKFSLSLLHAVDQIRLEYTATGTYVASEQSAPGRGLVLLTPLAVPESDIPSPLEVTDARVLNLGCADSAQMRACGSRSGDRWTAARIASEETVVGQLDLVPADS
jgi:hypothetical protein